MKSGKKIINPEEIFPNIQNDIEHALTYYSDKRISNLDVKVLTEGYEKCNPNKGPLGPTKYNYYIIHYVFSGSGYLEYKDNSDNFVKLKIGPNEIFLITPQKEVVYYQDKKDPWEYSWISFIIGKDNFLSIDTGPFQENVIKLEKYQSTREAFSRIQTLSNYSEGKNYAALSIFYDCMAQIQENTKTTITESRDKNHIKECLIYISKNYSNPSLTLGDISSHLFINEKYLSRLFSSYMGIPLFQYLNYTRIKQACYELTNDSLSISDVAFKVGFNDPLYFSKKFKLLTGISPQTYKKTIQKKS